jgi:hypothetical protein
MARLSDARPGREDGGYARVLGDPALGALITKVHATTISAGTELERMLAAAVPKPNPMTASDLGLFLSGRLTTGTWLLSKSMIRDQLKPVIGSSFEPDFVILLLDGRKALVIEVKDGETFDTKKAASEVRCLREFASRLQGCLLQRQMAYGVEIRLCSFNQSDKGEIVRGMKQKIARKEAMTGAEFCAIAGIDHAKLLLARTLDQDANFETFMRELSEIPTARAWLRKSFDFSES